LNIAFVPGWYTYGFSHLPLTDHHRKQVETDCWDKWLFELPRWDTTPADYVAWKHTENRCFGETYAPLYATNLGTVSNEKIECSVVGKTTLYTDWFPSWITSTAVTDPKWDGVRIDMAANIHSYYYGTVDHTGNGPTPDSADGRRKLDNLYRSGINHIFQKLHQTHPNWILGGVDAWFPAEMGDQLNFEPSGFITGPVNLVIAENWTKHWHSTDVGERFISWPDPVSNNQRMVDFSTATKIWKHFDDAGKHYGIMSKQITDYWDAKLKKVISLDEGDYGDWLDKEKRFSLAAAAMYGAVHSYAEKGVRSEWVDEYAVWPDNTIATTSSDRTKGMGWLGFPVTPMITVDSDAVLSDSVYTMVDDYTMVDHSVRWTTIKDKVWVRYFENGVVLLNPTNGNNGQDVKLLGSFKRLEKAGDSVNTGTDIVANTVNVPARDGLFLYGSIDALAYNCYAMDFNADAKIDIIDAGMVASRFGDSSLFSARFDVAPLWNPDGVINMIDIAVVAARVETDCSSFAVQ
ncbi:MAG: hypothetical protein GY762_17655, partial [Proteobacteria bacterium]|nr:hypothetical protein [Pseudomonadota bacterium]